MTRLYGRLRSDRRMTDSTAGANYHLESTLTWGSALNPTKALDVLLRWSKDQDVPAMVIDIPDGINVIVYADGGPQFARKDA